ncbi:MAG: glycosyltransferase [Roseiflexaceae bacterium]
MHIAVVHDYLNQYGGAERVLEAIHDIAPHAPVYTSIYDAQVMPAFYHDWDIRVSWMQNLPNWRRFFRHYFLFYPIAFERMQLSAYDIIISSSSAYAKGVRPRRGAIHICYCHTPMRFAWQTDQYIARENIRGIAKVVMQFLLRFVRAWDVRSASRVTHYIANSHVVAARIKQYYHREAVVIPPPVDLAPFENLPPGDYFLTGGRLVPYKRIDLAVKACTALNIPLVVFGDGRDKAELMAHAGPSVRFVGRVSDAERLRLFAECRGFLFPGEEDFGITPLEAMAAGRPVLAYRAGGALDTVVEGQTGLFFDMQDVESVKAGLCAMQTHEWQAQQIRTHAEQFSRERFMARMRAFIAHHAPGSEEYLHE